jgi:hypothetical protein
MDILCELLGLLAPVLDLINQVLGLIGLDAIDFAGLLGCEV